MKLYVSGTSPYSRKVRLVIYEKDLVGQVEEQLINPFENNNELVKVNPLGKIPVLILDNGETLFDSPVICRYLDSLPSDQPSLIPEDNVWQVLRWQALADGLTDAIYNLVMERRRPDNEQSTSWISMWTKDVEHALLEMESKLDQPGEVITLAASCSCHFYRIFGTPHGYIVLYLRQCAGGNVPKNTFLVREI